MMHRMICILCLMLGLSACAETEISQGASDGDADADGFESDSENDDADKAMDGDSDSMEAEEEYIADTDGDIIDHEASDDNEQESDGSSDGDDNGEADTEIVFEADTIESEDEAEFDLEEPCDSGVKDCWGTSVYECNSLGIWEHRFNCSLNNMRCYNGECVSCDNGSCCYNDGCEEFRSCDDLSTVIQCSDFLTCDAESVGQRRCVGNDIQQCDNWPLVGRSWLELYECRNIGEDAYCEAGVCLPGDPVECLPNLPDVDLSSWPTACSQESTSLFCDTESGLVWTKNVSFTELPSTAARQYCEDLTLEGISLWRLPSIDEARTLIHNCPDTEIGGTCLVYDACISMWWRNYTTSCSEACSFPDLDKFEDSYLSGVEIPGDSCFWTNVGTGDNAFRICTDGSLVTGAFPQSFSRSSSESVYAICIMETE